MRVGVTKQDVASEGQFLFVGKLDGLVPASRGQTCLFARVLASRRSHRQIAKANWGVLAEECRIV